MRIRGITALGILAFAWCFSCAATAQQSAIENLPAFAIPRDAVFETGDSFSYGGQRYRLFGVQACLRGTGFTNERGLRRDCGEVSLSGFAGLARELKTSCRAVGQAAAGTIAMVCTADVKGRALDLGIALISEGFAFASVDAQGAPGHMAYFLAEEEAKKAKRGLWAYPDLPHPRDALRRTR